MPHSPAELRRIFAAQAQSMSAHVAQRKGIIADALRRIGSLMGTEINAGITGAPGASRHGDTSLTVADVAYRNEFGIGVPERPWMRMTNAQQKYVWFRLCADIVQKTAKDQDRAERGLRRLGLRMISDYKATIRAGVSPPNSAETIERKGSSKPLIDTGQMINAHRAEVVLPDGTRELIA